MENSNVKLKNFKLKSKIRKNFFILTFCFVVFLSLIFINPYAVISQNQLGQTASILSFIQNISNKFKIDIQELLGLEVKAQAGITAGLVGHWKFDEGAGATASDASGSNNTGTLKNSPIWTTGKIGGALKFDGVDDYIQIANNVSTYLNMTNGSISLWYKSNGSGGAYPRLFNYYQSGDSLNLRLTEKALLEGVYAADWRSAGKVGVTIPNYTTDTNWHHVVFTWDVNGGAETLTLTFDGNRTADSDVIITPAAYSGSGYIAGGGDGSNSFNGLMDDFRIYNRVLSASEITELYNLGSASDIVPPVLSSGFPTGVLPAGTAQITLSLSTDENSICKYSPVPGINYALISDTFAVTGGISHSSIITGFINGKNYNYYVRCSDISGNANTSDYQISFSVSASQEDTTPPSIPANLSAFAASPSQINLSWNTSTDNTGVAGYKIYRCAGMGCAPTQLVSSQFASTLSYSDTGLTALTAYTYVVSAYDAAGNNSGQSISADATTLAQTGPLPAFPGAEGFGKNSMGGRGGKIIKVTNLNDGGSGSLRAAINDPDPRIVVFDVSGVINLQSDLSISNPYLTIVGQTSPGGILVTGRPITINTHDVIIRHMRFRVGSHNVANAEQHDTIGIYGNSVPSWFPNPAYNIIIDHSSISWGIDENFSIGLGATDVTVQWSIVSEGLNNAGHPKGAHSKGLMVSTKYTTSPMNVSVHHNYFAHNVDRNPLLCCGSGVATLDAVNNVVYNFKGSFSMYTENKEKVNWIHNYVKQGPNSNFFAYEVQHTGGSSTPFIYVEGNIGSRRLNQTDNQWSVGYMWHDQLLDQGFRTMTPWPAEPVTKIAMSYNYALQVLESVGASVPIRDSVDTRVIADFAKGTGGYINSVAYPGGFPVFASPAVPLDSDNDGMPDNWEIAKGLNSHNSADANNIVPAGASVNDRYKDYAYIEYYLGGLADKITSPSPDIIMLHAPINLAAAPVSSSQINLSWTASTDNAGITGYKIYRCADSGCSPTAQIATTAVNSYSDTGLTASAAYTYAVSAYNASGSESAKSSFVTAAVQSQIPQCSDTIDNDKDGKIDFNSANPDPDCLSLADNSESDSTPPLISSVEATTISSTTARIDWITDEPSTSQVEYGFTADYTALTIKEDNFSTSHSVILINLSSNNTYNFKVNSEDSSNNKSFSANYSFKTPGLTDTVPPAPTTDITAKNITQTSVDLLTWTAAGDDGNTGTAYQFDVRYTTVDMDENNWNASHITKATGEPTPKPAGSLMNYTLVGLTPNTTYKVALKTLDEVLNQSQISNIITFTTLKAETAPAPAPSAPPSGGGGGGSSTISDTTPAPKITDLKAQGADKQVRLTWKNPESSDWVRTILVRKTGDFANSIKDGQIVFEGTEREFTDINLKNNQTYYYSLFTIDRKPNYSRPATIMVKTIADKVSLEEIKPALITARAQEALNLAGEAAEITKSDINSFLSKFKFKRDKAREDISLKQYVNKLVKDLKYLMADRQIALNHFIAYGTQTTMKLGAGERAGVINSYESAFNKLPVTAEEWTDAIKIANGRWPTEISASAQAKASQEFKKIYKRAPNMKQANDNAAVAVMAYGLRPAKRNANSEKAAIKSFKAIYGYAPKLATDWDIVRAVAYSGARR